MAYDPADLKLPAWLLKSLDWLVRLRLPLLPGWHLGFTRPGIVFVAGLIAVWGAAFYSGNNLLYLCGAMLFSLMLASLLQGARLLRQLPLPVPPRMQAGESLVSRHVMASGLVAPCSAVVAVSTVCDGQRLQLDARWHGHALRWDGRLQLPRRGVFVCDQIDLVTAAPLGMFELGCRRHGPVEYLVMPQPVAWSGGMPGDAGERGRVGDQWHDLRAYVAGDSPRRIHWRKAQGEPATWAVKRFAAADDARENSCLRLDLRLPANCSQRDFERLIGQAWYWVMQRRQLAASEAGTLIIGSRHFELGVAAEYRLALRALASAVVAGEAPAGDRGILLSLIRAQAAA